MDDLVKVIPEKWRGTALFMLAASPYITRAFHSLINGRGIRGTMSAIWLGTNSPTMANTPTDQKPT